MEFCNGDFVKKGGNFEVFNSSLQASKKIR